MTNSNNNQDNLLGKAPLVQDFANAWKQLGLGQQRGSRRLRTLEWCLFEASRDRELDFLKGAKCVSISSDERNGRLLVKYAASDDQLNVQYGCMALLRDAGGSAYDIAAAVHKAVERFCTRRVLHPGLNAGKPRRECNLPVQEHIRDRIEMFTADGAANEQLAARLLHPGSSRSNCQKLPNLSMILRDKAHATRRLTERTFQADPNLDRNMQAVVTGETSVARLLKNSRLFQCIFEQEVCKQVRSGSAAGMQGSVRDMSFAKQRFDSTAKPLGRCLLNLDAAISTMDIICRQRPTTSKEHRGGRDFLTLISEPRSLLLMGMLADASDECLVLTRFFDREAFRVEDMAEQLSAFRRQIRRLFAEKGCLGSGYTNLALSHLRRTKLVPVPGHSPVALGGQGAVSPETVTDCLGIMVAWSRLADEVAQTEFPEHELLACFRVFNLAPLDGPKRARPSATSIVPAPVPATQQDLNRLADAFKVDSTCLLNQFREHQRIAELEFARTPGLSVATAWRCALQQTQANSRRRRNFPAQSLKALLHRFMVTPGSTAGIEQNFSRFKRFLGEHWQGSEVAEERRLVLQLAQSALPAADNELLGKARLIWASTFGEPRRGQSGKLWRIAETQLQETVQTGAAWLRRRRQDSTAAATAMARVLDAALSPAAAATDQAVEASALAAWTERHEKEACFQRAAHAKRQCAAVQEGVLPMEALGPEATQQMANFQEQEQTRQRNLDSRQQLLAKTRTPPQAPNIHGSRVFVHEEAMAVLNRWQNQWLLKCRQAQLRLVQDKATAQVFVTMNPTAPGDRIQCVAAMNGAVLCTPELLAAPPGVAVQLKRALSLPRHIFLSVACNDRHRAMMCLIQRVCHLPEARCRWTWYLEADGAERQALFFARARKRGANHRRELTTLLTPGQLKSAAFEAFPNCMTLSSFLTAIHRVDARFTQLGLCKR